MTLRRFPIRRTVVVNTKTGRSFRGVLYAKRGPLLVLKGAVTFDGPTEIPVDGEAIVERANVDWIQVLPV